MTILYVDVSTGFQPSFSDLNVVRHGEEIDAYKPSLTLPSRTLHLLFRVFLLQITVTRYLLEIASRPIGSYYSTDLEE